MATDRRPIKMRDYAILRSQNLPNFNQTSSY